MALSNVEEKLKGMGLILPTSTPSKGIYKSVLVDGTKLYLSGHVSVNTDGSPIAGKLGKDLDEEQGKLAARQCGLAMIASIKRQIGDLDRVRRVIKLLGMVNSTPDYTGHPVIINGCSELFREIWGEDNGVGARSAVGMGSLPGNVAVEIEAIFEIYE